MDSNVSHAIIYIINIIYLVVFFYMYNIHIELKIIRSDFCRLYEKTTLLFPQKLFHDGIRCVGRERREHLNEKKGIFSKKEKNEDHRLIAVFT